MRKDANRLLPECFQVLSDNKKLYFLPYISVMISLFVMWLIISHMLSIEAHVIRTGQVNVVRYSLTMAMVLGFGYLFNFLNGLAHASSVRYLISKLSGKPILLRTAICRTLRHIHRYAYWTIFAVTIGISTRFSKTIAAKLIGTSKWATATFLHLPLLMQDNACRPVKITQQSYALLLEQYGKDPLVENFKSSKITFILRLFAFIPLIIGLSITTQHSISLGLSGTFMILFMVGMANQTALQVLVSCLYLRIQGQQELPLNTDEMNKAFKTYVKSSVKDRHI